MRVPLLLATLLVASVASAGPLDRLVDPTLLPSTREAIVAEACAPATVVTADDLRSLFPRCERPEQIALARVAHCRRDPALAGVMMEVFLRSKLSLGAQDHDPDIFERLLRGLLALPEEELAAAVGELDVAWISEASWTALEQGWLTPIAGSGRIAPPNTVSGETADALTREMLLSHFAGGRDALLELQTDSGDAATRLLDKLQTMHLAALVTHGPAEDLELVAEVLRQRDDPGPVLVPAVAARLPEAPVLAALHEELLARGPTGSQGVAPYDPDEPLDAVQVPPGEWLTPATPHRGSLSPWWLVLGGLGLLAGAWIESLRRWPHRRERLFRLAAVTAPLALVLALEGCLSVAGVPHPPGLVDIVSLTRGHDEAFDERALEGENWIVSIDPRMRSQQFTPRKAPGVLRIATLGESSAHAANYLVEEGFSARLGVHLQAALPARQIEVIHAGIGGALSSQIRGVASQLLDWETDLLVLYFGNNDLDFLPEVARYEGFDLKRLRRHTALGRIRLVGFPSRWLADVDAVGTEFAQAREGEALTPEEHADVVAFAREHAIANMERIVADAREHGAEVLIVAQGPREDVRAIGVEAARRTGAALLDGAGVIEAHARAAGLDGPLLGSPHYSRYYWDYVHPTRLGHALLGAAIAPAAIDALAER